jgi:hypothetical protein
MPAEERLETPAQRFPIEIAPQPKSLAQTRVRARSPRLLQPP